MFILRKDVTAFSANISGFVRKRVRIKIINAIGTRVIINGVT
ncbi:hypothetical protein [Cytobacillus luteolus]|nr:hypothetical protein [Cytobacillus luteolus]